MIKITSLLIGIVFMGANTLAEDLGTISQTFPIKEEGFTAMIKRKLEKVDIEEHKDKMQKIARERIENPNPVEGIAQTEKDRTFYFDPTYTLDEDAVLPCGKVLYQAGTRVNPLDHMDLDRRMIFIDARQKAQIAWLKEFLGEKLTKSVDVWEMKDKEDKIEDRIILIGGSVFKLKEELANYNHNIYFDQFGELVGRFGIKAVPAIAIQEGKLLKIEEIKIN